MHMKIGSREDGIVYLGFTSRSTPLRLSRWIEQAFGIIVTEKQSPGNTYKCNFRPSVYGMSVFYFWLQVPQVMRLGMLETT